MVHVQSSKVSFSRAPVSIYLSLQSQNRLSTGARAKLEQVKYTLGLSPDTSHITLQGLDSIISAVLSRCKVPEVLQGESLRNCKVTQETLWCQEKKN